MISVFTNNRAGRRLREKVNQVNPELRPEVRSRYTAVVTLIKADSQEILCEIGVPHQAVGSGEYSADCAELVADFVVKTLQGQERGDVRIPVAFQRGNYLVESISPASLTNDTEARAVTNAILVAFEALALEGSGITAYLSCDVHDRFGTGIRAAYRISVRLPLGEGELRGEFSGTNRLALQADKRWLSNFFTEAAKWLPRWVWWKAKSSRDREAGDMSVHSWAGSMTLAAVSYVFGEERPGVTKTELRAGLDALQLALLDELAP